MKKSVLALIVIAAFIAGACASYTCPTYSKAPKTGPVKQTKI